MKYSMGSGIIRCIGALKTFSNFRVLRSFGRFEVPCGHRQKHPEFGHKMYKVTSRHMKICESQSQIK